MNLSQVCALCRQCDGAAYQSPPSLFAGSLTAKIVVVGQNPGEIHDTDKFRLAMGEEMLRLCNENNAGKFFEAWYRADYGSSGNAKMLSEIFGNDWLNSEKFLYTNAVRCRTKANATPGEDMVVACNTWTRKLLFASKRSGVVLLGNIAASQLLGKHVDKLPVNSVRRHPRYGVLLRLPHPATWKPKQLDEIRALFDEFLLAIGDTHATKS